LFFFFCCCSFCLQKEQQQKKKESKLFAKGYLLLIKTKEMFERNFKNNKKLFGKNMKIKRSFSFC
jgi:hypothetical protein